MCLRRPGGSPPRTPVYTVEVEARGEDARLGSLNAALKAGRYDFRVGAIVDLYHLAGPREAAAQLAAEALADPVLQRARITAAPAPLPPGWLEVAPRPGVTDRAAASVLLAAQLCNINGLLAAARGRRYQILGDPRAAADCLALHNPIIEQRSCDAPLPSPFDAPHPTPPPVERIPLRHLSPDALDALTAARRLALDAAELRAIQARFEALGRDPTDVELEMLAQTWSEHCVHKTFKAQISHTVYDTAGTVLRQEIIDGLLPTYIQAATEAAAKPWVRSAFIDNAGIVALTDGWELAFKVETHNRPSALEPFGGAHTGMGGVIRDILGVSAQPIANLDALCFGPPEMSADALPPGVLHPQVVRRGVLAGIEDYGNTMGIPTVAGAILYDVGYAANPLVFCGCLGVLPAGSHPRRAAPGDALVVLGGRTGRDGLRGATFSSMELSAASARLSSGAVQIGEPIEERRVQEVVLAARDLQLYSAITDCGAGGLSSAIGEMAAGLGAWVELDAAPLKYAGLAAWEVWLSEAQERMVLAVPEGCWGSLQALCAELGCEATRLGHLTGDGWLRVQWRGEVVCELEVELLHAGCPRRVLEARWQPPPPAAPVWEAPDDLTGALLALLGSLNGASREGVVRRFDHEVQGGTWGRPLVGVAGEGPGDGVVVVPLALQGEASPLGVAIGLGINPHVGRLDPYRMAWAAVDEAARNVVAVGGDPDRLALLDNFCWGNPALPDRLGALVECARGCFDAARAYEAPFISGKDSLNNEYTVLDGTRRSIPGTLLISALAVVPEASGAVSSDAKAEGGVLYLVGVTREELGASALLRHYGDGSGEAPKGEGRGLGWMRGLHGAMRGGLVQACHDCSEGGLAAALAELCLGGQRGAVVALEGAPTEEVLSTAALLFAESLARFVVEVAPKDAAAFEAAMAGHPVGRLGVVGGEVLQISRGGRMVVEASVQALREAFLGGLDGAL